METTQKMQQLPQTDRQLGHLSLLRGALFALHHGQHHPEKHGGRPAHPVAHPPVGHLLCQARQCHPLP